jgi:hypothetical protein
MTSSPEPRRIHFDGADTRPDSPLIARPDLDARIAIGSRWLVGSGAQALGDHESRGGFHAWYDPERREYSYLYAEITGYMLTMLCAAAQPEPLTIARARYAADWLVREMLDEGRGFRCLEPVGTDRFNHKRNHQYAFDNGVIINGLAQLHRKTGETSYLETARRVAEWLLRIQLPSGGFPAALDGETGAILHCEDGWSTQPGPSQAKVAIGLYNVGELLRDERFCAAAIRACEFALEFQDTTGRFQTTGNQNCTNSHPHAYAAEALWAIGHRAERADFLQASARATRWLLENMSAAGQVPRLCHDGGLVYHERVDVVAQTLRLTLLHLESERLPRRFANVPHRLADKLVAYQSHDPDLRACGGFYFGKLSHGSEVRNVNTWVSAFAIQALELFRDHLTGTADLAPFDLV